jgi:uncharacterized protein (DUF58 family)
LAAWTVVVEDEVRRVASASAGNHDGPPALHPGVLFPYVPAGQLRKGAYRGRLTERGRHQFGPVRLSTQFPFGLFSRTITIGQSETLVVFPRLGQLTEGWAARRLEALAGADRRRQRSGNEGDFYGVREWRSGDGRRLVHWRTSARLGKLVVRQFERPRSRDLAVVLDLWQPERPSTDHLENVELAVSFAATVLSDTCRQGGSSVFLAPGEAGQPCWGGPASPALLQGLMERLATVEARSDDPLPAVLADTLLRTAAGAEIVVASTRPVDLTDTARFASLWSDPALREPMRRIRCVDASSDSLAQYFRVE